MNITDISGIREATAQRMASHGIDTVEAVAHASIEQLAAVPGIGASRAAALRAAANRLLSEAAAGADESGVADSDQPDATTGTEASVAPAENTDGPAEPDTPPETATRDRKGETDGKKRKAEKKRKKGKKGKKGKNGKKKEKKKRQKKDKGRKRSKKGGK